MCSNTIAPEAVIQVGVHVVAKVIVVVAAFL